MCQASAWPESPQRLRARRAICALPPGVASALRRCKRAFERRRATGQRSSLCLCSCRSARPTPARRLPALRHAPESSPDEAWAASSPGVPPLACPEQSRRPLQPPAQAGGEGCKEPTGRATVTEALVARRCCSEATATRSSCVCSACIVILALPGSLPKRRAPAPARLPPAGAQACLCTPVRQPARWPAHGSSASHGWWRPIGSALPAALLPPLREKAFPAKFCPLWRPCNALSGNFLQLWWTGF